MAARTGLCKFLLACVLNSTTPNTHLWFTMFGHSSWMIRIVANFVSKFSNFRYHGNKHRFFKFQRVCWEFFSGVMSELCLGACMPNLMFEHLAVLEIVTFNAQKWVTWPWPHPLFAIFFSGKMSGLCQGSCLGSCIGLPNFKFASLAILELLAFNAQKIKGHVTLTPALFSRIFFRGHVATLTGIMHDKFAPSAILELLAFNAQ